MDRNSWNQRCQVIKNNKKKKKIKIIKRIIKIYISLIAINPIKISDFDIFCKYDGWFLIIMKIIIINKEKKKRDKDI
jgi:hypothetical protein